MESTTEQKKAGHSGAKIFCQQFNKIHKENTELDILLYCFPFFVIFVLKVLFVV